MTDSTKDIRESKQETSLRELIIEAKFNIRPTDMVDDEPLTQHRTVKQVIEDYFETEEAKRFEKLIAQERTRAQIEALKAVNVLRNEYDTKDSIAYQISELESLLRKRRSRNE